MAYYGNILEEELKNKVAHDLFDRQRQKELAKKIEPKVYEYGFLKK